VLHANCGVEVANRTTRVPDATVPSFCRVCGNLCPLLVEVTDGRVTRVTGDPENPLYEGYTCIKGRAQPEFLAHPARLLHSQERSADGGHVPVDVDVAIDAIAARLHDILHRHGPRAIASFSGTMQVASFPTGPAMMTAFMIAIGSRMSYTTNTIDKGGKQIAEALHGRWMAPPQGFDEPDVALLIGINPMVTYTGFPAGHPGHWLGRSLERGMQLIVIDPRRSDVAKRASIFLQPRPGEDPAILAGMINVILADDLYDHDFVTAHTQGLEALRAAVAPFTPEEVARRADIPPEDLVMAARTFARARRGYAMAGTGPNMSGQGSLVEYLVLDLESLCGHWLRAGEVVRNAPTLLPPLTPKAQAAPPRSAIRGNEGLRVRGLSATTAGLPTATLADEILLAGEGQIRALLSFAGNPVVAFPDQLKTIEALRRLELLVQIDPWMSQTARLAHYVIAPPMPLEVPATTALLDELSIRSTGYGLGESHAQYSAAVLAPPPGAQLIEEWRFFYRLAVRMGLTLKLPTPTGRVELDMGEEPTTDELLRLITAGSRVPLDDVRRNRDGALYPDPPVVVAPADRGWEGRLELADVEMMHDLAEVAHRETVGGPPASSDGAFPFRLVCRRQMHMFNSSGNIPATNHGRPYNPAYMHPDDLEHLGINPGDEVQISSVRAVIPGIVAADATLRRGLVSMAFGFGDGPDRDTDVRDIGSSPSRLVPNDEVFDRFIGQPRMSNLPVDVRPTRAHDSSSRC
jgi:anaerobic selenocysteine-containing dehydrogenase